jgi:predicted TIM-barrel fold metal-dependent hydrolase
MAEELDIPLGVEIGPAPPSTPSFFATAKYADQYGDPLVLAEALARHPKLRAYVLHGGWPHVKGMIALMSAHPQLYVGISAIEWYLPRVEFHKYLRRLVEAGFAKRIMFGSDEMIWPDASKLAIDGVNAADFPSPKQKRDILYNNAARFLRFDPASMTVQ